MIKLNLGCWKRNFPGFINIDVIDYPHVHFKRDVKDLSIFEDNSVDLIYASHVMEYFLYEEAKEALKEWRRVLKPGGVLKLAVPDFEALVKVYQKTGDLLELRGSIFAITDKVLDVNGRLVFHKMVYDERLLRKTLEECGFSDIKKYDWKDFLPEGVIDRSASYLPSRDHIRGILVSLNVEARKAGSLGAGLLKAKHEIGHFKKRIKNKLKRMTRKDMLPRKELYKE